MGWWCSFLSQRPLHPQALYILLKNIYSSPSRRTCLNLFWIFLDSLLHLTAPPISSCSFSYHLSVAPAPHLLSQSGTPSTWKSPTPAPRRPPPLVSVPHTVCLYLPPFPASVRPPFLTSSCTQVLLSTWWFSLSLVPPYPLCLCFYIPVCDAEYFHLLILSFYVGWIFARRARGQGISTPYQLLAPVLGPPATWTCWCRSGYPPPTPLSYLSHTVDSSLWGVALDIV